MKCSLGISNFLEEKLVFLEGISLSPSVVFLYFFALITDWRRVSYLFLLFFGILHSDAYIFPFLLCFSPLFFSQLFAEKTLEGPLDCKEIQPVHSKGDQSWVFFGRTDAEAETPVLWPRHAKSWLIGKDSDAGRDCGQEEKGTTEDEMAGWHHQLDGYEFG